MELFFRSAAVSFGSAAIAVCLAAILSLATFGRNRFVFRCQASLVSSLLLLPSYVVAGAWSAGFGSMGWWTLSQVTAAKAPLVGMASVIWIHGMAATPVAMLLLVLGLHRCPVSMVELAKLDGGSRQQFLRGIWPTWYVWILGTFFLVAAWVSGDMVVTNLFQVATLTEQCYLDSMVEQLHWSRTIAASSLSISLGLIAMVLLGSQWSRGQSVRQGGAWNRSPLGSNALALMLGGLVTLLIVGVPLANLIVKAGWIAHQMESGAIHRAWSGTSAITHVVRVPIEYGDEFGWSMSLAGWSATLACVVASAGVFSIIPMVRNSWCCRFRKRDAYEKAFFEGAIAILLMTFALPGPVVSSLVIDLFQLPVMGFAWLNDHTLAAPILCLQFRLLPLAVFAFVIVAQQWENRVGDTWRIDKSKPRWARVCTYGCAMTIPIATVWIVVFALAMGDLSSYLPCLPPGVTTVSMRIFDLLHYGVRSSEAGLILFLAIAGSTIGWWFQKIYR